MRKSIFNTLSIAAGAAAAYGGLATAVRATVAQLRDFSAGELARFTFLKAEPMFFLAAVLTAALLLDRGPELVGLSGAGEGAALRRRGRKLQGFSAAAVFLLILSSGLMSSSYERHIKKTGRFSPMPKTSYTDCRNGRCVKIVHNAMGLRGPVLPPARRPGVGRILLVGDSFVYGSGLEERELLSARLLEELNRRTPGRPWETGNFAVPGFNFHSAVRTLESAAREFSPDGVVIGLLKDNDLLTPDFWDHLDSYGFFLWNLSTVFDLESEVNRIEVARDSPRYGTPLPGDILRKFEADLARLLALQKELGLRIVVYSFLGPTELFKDAQKDGRLTVLWPEEEQRASDSFFMKDDGHPTAAGNAMIAARIAPALLK